MLINWFTVVAQVINFLILVWLLKHFLYKPILNAIDAREKGIAAKLAEAEAKKADAQKERDDFQHKNEAFDKERTGLLKKATDDANAERQQLLDQARKDADTLRAKRQEALQNEQLHLSQEIIRWTQKQVFDITRKTLSDLANASLEERMCDAFVDRLRTVNGAAKEQLIAAFKNSPQPAQVRSAFQLPQTAKKRSRKCGEGNFRCGNASPVRDRSGTGQRHRAVCQRAEGRLEYRRLSHDAGKERQ